LLLFSPFVLLICSHKIPTLASCSFDEIVDAAIPGQVQFLQLYVNRDREITRKYVQHAEKRGIKGLFITVDAPQLGRREKDMRMRFVDESGVAKVQENQSGVKKDEGVARAISVSSAQAFTRCSEQKPLLVIYRPCLVMERYSLVQEYHKQYVLGSFHRLSDR
jgi:hypothetical protein